MSPVASTNDRYRSIRNVLWVVLFLNLAVAGAKLVYGLISHSAAMEADGFHSLFDGASNVIGLVGMWFASRPADDEHPYGHAKFETFAAGLIGVLLIFACYTVGRGAFVSLFGRGAPTDVTAVSFVIMIGTLAINIFVTTWERRAGKRLGSEVLVADASHTLSDVMVSLGVIASLVIVKLGFAQADGIVALLVAVIIMRTAWGILRGVLYTLGTPRVCRRTTSPPWRAPYRAWSVATPFALGGQRRTCMWICTCRWRPAPPLKKATPSPIRSRRRCVLSTGRSPMWSCTWSRPGAYPLRDATR